MPCHVRLHKRTRAGGLTQNANAAAALTCAYSRTGTPLPWTHAQADKDYLSRLLPIGHELCILPKTCLNTFGDAQPVYELGEAFEPGHGGSWADPPQVAQNLGL